MSAIIVENLVRRFKTLAAVDNINFTVEEGEAFGFLGPNGAGKTTTINILCTLLSPTSGRAEVNGYDCVKNPDQVRASIGLVFQDRTLDDELTAEENLKFHGYLYNIPRDILKARMEEMLRLVELWERKDDIIKRFSGGMKRRLEIARGLLHYPKVLFLDEPTLGLDPQTRTYIWEFIRELKRREGVTIFMTTHYLEEAEFCDRLAIIDHGKIIALGTPEELKRTVGEEVIYLHAKDEARARQEIKEFFGLETKQDDNGLMLAVSSGETFIPQLVSRLTPATGGITSISLKKPTLNDVFLNLTGRRIREEESSDKDVLREWLKDRPSHK